MDRRVLKNRTVLVPSLALLGAFASPLANAQAGASNAGIDDDTARLETVTVTAQKRAENLQETPIAITALSQDVLETRQLFNVNEIAQYVPNLQYSSSAAGTASASSFSIRGIGQLDFISTTDPGVGTYLDGVYLARVTGAALDLADIERVEVLRGPQGTLFGRNTIGGAVSVITRKPSGERGIRGQVMAGNHGQFRGRVIADIPVIDDVLAAKLTLLAKVSDGYGEDREPLGGQGGLGKDDDLAAALQLRWTQSDRAEMILSMDLSQRRGTAIPQGRVFFDATSAAGQIYDDGGLNSVIGTNFDFDSDDLKSITVDTPMNDDIDVFGLSLNTDLEFDAFNLKMITAYRDQEAVNGQDFDGGNNPILNQFITSEQWQLSQEFQLTGVALSDRLEWFAGAYAFVEDGRFVSDVQLNNIQVDIDTQNKTESFAVFAQGNYEINDRLSASLGLRYTSETKEIEIDTLFGGAPLVLDGVADQKFTSLTPKAGLEYQATDDVMVYASVAQGFRSGGYNGRPFSPNDLAPFDEETSTSYEIGVKSDLADDRLRLNLAGFFNEYKDIQLTATTTDAQGQFIVVTDNAGRADLYGFELEFEALPTPELFLFGSVGYTNTDDLEPQAGYILPQNTTTLPLASEWTVGVGGTYTMAVSDRIEGTFGLDYAYRSKYFPQFNNSPRAEQDGYGLLNARFELRPDDADWSVTLWGKNLTDEVYRTFGQDSAVSGIPTVVGFFGPTRMFGVTLGFEFD